MKNNYICSRVKVIDRYGIIGDRGYIGAAIQLDLFEKANIRFEVPYRSNQKDWKHAFALFPKTYYHPTMK